MKTPKYLFIVFLSLLVTTSCSKKDDDLGGETEVPSGKVAFSKYGMRAYFPENKWGKQTVDSYNSINYEMECMSTFLLSSAIAIENTTGYSVQIHFMRFKTSSFENADSGKANEFVDQVHNIYDGYPEYSALSAVTPAQIGRYNALKFDCRKSGESIEESYFIHYENRIYRIVLVIPQDKVDLYYSECKEIINSIQLSSEYDI